MKKSRKNKKITAKIIKSKITENHKRKKDLGGGQFDLCSGGISWPMGGFGYIEITKK